MALIQNSDQLVNFRSLAKQMSDMQARIAKLESALSITNNDVGLLGMDKYTMPQAGTSAPAGASNAVNVTVDFGASFSHYAETVVTGQSWVTLDSQIVVNPFNVSIDGGELAILSFSPVIHSIIAGDGFTLAVYTPVEAKGTYTFSCIGVEP